jgi:small subunit ribosomal protein S29
MQMESTSMLLNTIMEVNKAILQNLYLSKTYPGIPIGSDRVSLYQLAQRGRDDHNLAWPVFCALWSELTLPNTNENQAVGHRPPILYCADNISHLFVPSRYQTLDAENNIRPIHALDLALPRHFIDHVTGIKALPNGGIVLGATSNSDFVLCPPLDVGIEMGEARAKTPQSTPAVSDFWNPLQRIDQRVMDICSNLDTLRLQGVSREEAKSIIEYWAFNGLVRERIADSWIGEKWTMSGGGVLGELEKAVVRMRF